MAASRQSILKELGADKLMTEEQIDRYTREAEPILEEGDDVMRMDDIMEVMDKSQDIFSEKMLALTPGDLEKEIGEGDRKTTLGRRIEFLGWHETYHTGQTEFLRQLAGTDDKVI
jgi:uncharacterized damage-inducible protein DinB